MNHKKKGIVFTFDRTWRNLFGRGTMTSFVGLTVASVLCRNHSTMTHLDIQQEIWISFMLLFQGTRCFNPSYKLGTNYFHSQSIGQNSLNWAARYSTYLRQLVCRIISTISSVRAVYERPERGLSSLDSSIWNTVINVSCF